MLERVGLGERWTDSYGNLFDPAISSLNGSERTRKL
jgi:hypothetical protein